MAYSNFHYSIERGRELFESIQLLNTAIIKSKEKKIDPSYESRLKKICESPALEAINKAITYLAENEKISRDQAALQIIEAMRELDSIWGDYVAMEGIDRLRSLLKNH
jgi:GTP1/Obg family GTP-binding protein